MQGTRAREVRDQVGHLVEQHTAALEEDVLRIGRRERHRQQVHPGLFGRARGLQVVAAPAGRDHVGPAVAPALAEGPHVVARQLARGEALATIEAEVGVAPEQRLVVQRRHVVVPQVARVAGVSDRRDDRVHLEHGAPASQRVGAAAELEDRRAAGVGHLALVVEARGLLVVDPLEGHAGDVGAQHVVLERNQPGARIDADIVVVPMVGQFEIDAAHRTPKISTRRRDFNVAGQRHGARKSSVDAGPRMRRRCPRGLARRTPDQMPRAAPPPLADDAVERVRGAPAHGTAPRRTAGSPRRWHDD